MGPPKKEKALGTEKAISFLERLFPAEPSSIARGVDRVLLSLERRGITERKKRHPHSNQKEEWPGGGNLEVCMNSLERGD